MSCRHRQRLTSVRRGRRLADWCRFVSVVVCSASLNAQEPPRPNVVNDPPKSPQEQARLFHVPEGFVVELVASEPDVIKPINLNFDAAGRLYVTQSVEYPIPAPPDRLGRDQIKRLEDADGDGRFETISTFADGLNIPIGVTPAPGGILGFSIPHLYQLTSGNNASPARKRVVDFGTFGYEDTHGMISSLNWWIDGWIYGCHGFVNTSDTAGSDGMRVKMVSGNTYRLKADGSHIEHFSHGQVNPFGMTFDPWGNVFTADCHSRPATMLLRGGHYPPSRGDGLGLAPELMRHSHGSTGIAGIACYAADQFPEEYRGSLFIGNPLTGRINHDRLTRAGSTYTAKEQPDFLVCDDLWFRPVDLKLGPDGSLYIADLYNCIIGHYEVPLTHPKRDRQHGRIWRVRYVGTANERPRPQVAKSVDLTRRTLNGLLECLADPNLAIRTHATHELVERIGPPAVEPCRELLRNAPSETQRAHVVWVLHRLDALTPEQCLASLDDPSPLVRTHLIKVLGETPAWSDAVRTRVQSQLADAEGFVQRAAVESLGLQSHASSVNPLLQLWRRANPLDTQLIHALKMALRNLVQELGNLPELELQYAGAPDDLAHLAMVSLGIPSRSSAEFLWQRFQKRQYPEERLPDVLRHVVRYLGDDRLPEPLALVASYQNHDLDTQAKVVSAMHQGLQERGAPPAPVLVDWGARLAAPLLESGVAEQIERGFELISQLRLTGVAEPLIRLSAIDAPYAAGRFRALTALTAMNPDQAAPILFLLLDEERELPGARRFAAENLALRQDAGTREKILARLPEAPLPIAGAFARGLAADRAGAERLLTLIEQGKVLPRVLQDQRIEKLLPLSGVPDVEARVAKLTADLPSADLQMQRLIGFHKTAFSKTTPDPVRGAAIFRKSCAVCHQLENIGDKIGPELDGIGLRGLDRLLEDVLDPNRTVDKNYLPSVVATVSGQVLKGLVTGQEGETLLLIDQYGKQQRIPLADIEDRRRINGSSMPSNVAEFLTDVELYDLLQFLLTKTVKRELPGL